MKEFMLKTGAVYELSNKYFETKTGKQFPYYQLKTPSGDFIPPGSKKERDALSAGKYEMRYYALCPGCGLPIQCCNMFQAIIENSRKKKPGEYGKHINNIPGLGRYKDEVFEEKYENCPYARLKHHDISKRKDPQSKEVKELLTVLIENYDKVIEVLSRSIGFFISETLAKEMLQHCFATKQFAYRKATKFNLPWTFALSTQSYSLWGRKIRPVDENSIDIVEQLRVKAPELYIEEGTDQIRSRDKARYTFAFCGHISRPKLSKDDCNQFIDMQIWKDDFSLGTIKIPVRESLFRDYLEGRIPMKKSHPQLLEFAQTFNH